MQICPPFLCRLALFVGLVCQVLPMKAATFYWDFDPATAGNQNGSGTWLSGEAAGSAQWTGTPGGTNTPWINGNNNANLGGTSGYTNNGVGGTITLGENITLNRIDKSSQTTAYIIEPGTGGYGITLTGSGAGFGNNNATAAAALTINVSVGGNVGMQKFNTGTVILTAANTWTGGTRITAHSTSGSSSVLQIGNGGTTGTVGSGDVTFASVGATTGAQSVLAFNRSDSVTLTQNLVTTGGTDPNKGILRQAGSGVLIVASANTAFTGTAEVNIGTLQIGDGATSGSLGTATGISVANGGILRFDRSDAVSFSVPVSGAGRIVKANTNTLTLTGTGSTLSGTTTIETGVLQLGNDNALSTATTVVFGGTGTLDMNGFDQTVASLSVGNNLTGIVTGGATSSLTAAGANMSIGGTAVSTTATLDLSGIGQFIFNGPTQTLSVGGAYVTNDPPATVTSGTLTLAQDNLITASAVNVGFINAGGGNHENTGTLNLGQTNSITAATLNIGDIKNQGFVQFAAGISGGTVTLRGTNAAQRMDILIGRHDSNGVVVDQSYFNSNGGTLDALVGTMTLGVTNDRANAGQGRFTMGAGLLDATTIVLGRRVSSSNTAMNAGASPTGVLELNGGTILVRTITFADKLDTGTLGTVTGIFNFNSGLLRAQTIQGGAGTTGVSRRINWTEGTIETYNSTTDLTINDVTLALQGTASRVFNVASGRSITMNGPIINGTTAPTVAFVKQGTGTLLMGGSGSTHTGNIELQQGILRTTASDVLSNGATLAFTGSSTLDLQGNSDAISTLTMTTTSSVTATVLGSGGTLTLNGTPNWNIGGITANTATVLDMAGLSHFVFNSSNADISLGSQSNVVNNNVTVTLAQDNVITAKSFGVASVVSGNVGGQNLATVNLGQTNVINASTVVVGNYKSNARLQFTSGITNGSLQIRATNGTGRASLLIGKGQSGAIATNAVVDTTGGSLDALISTLIIGQNDNSGTQASTTTGSLLMNAGILDATSIVLGDLMNNSTDANYAGSGTLTLSGTGTVKVGTLTLSQRSASTGNGFSNGTFNLNGGTLQATTIQRGTAPKGTATFNWSAGTVANYDSSTDLTVTGINLTLTGSGDRSFNITTGRTATVNSSLGDGTGAGAQAFTKTGDGTLRLLGASTYSGITTIQAGVLFAGNSTGSATGIGGIQVTAGGTLAGNGRLVPQGSASLINQGTLKAGGIDSTGASGLTLDLSSTTGGLTSTGTLAFDLFTNAGDNSGIASSADRLIITQAAAGDIQLSGTLYLGLGTGSTLTGLSFATGDRWLLVDWSGLTGGTPSVNFSQVSAPEIVLPSNLGWTYEFNQNGLYAVVAVVPEPGRVLLLMVGLSVSCLRRRRR